MSLGTRLKAARTAKGLSLRQVQAQTGVSASNISRAERGGNMYAESFIALAKCYDVSADELADNVPMRAMPGENMVDPYIVALGTAHNPEDALLALVRSVEFYTNEGYKPQGGVSVIQQPVEHGMTWCMAMQAMGRDRGTK